jgi:hypothetical protein
VTGAMVSTDMELPSFLLLPTRRAFFYRFERWGKRQSRPPFTPRLET